MTTPAPAPVSFEHTFHCHACGMQESWTSEQAAWAASVWHVYTRHRDLWVERAGTDRVPQDRPPEFYGRRYAVDAKTLQQQWGLTDADLAAVDEFVDQPPENVGPPS